MCPKPSGPPPHFHPQLVFGISRMAQINVGFFLLLFYWAIGSKLNRWVLIYTLCSFLGNLWIENSRKEIRKILRIVFC